MTGGSKRIGELREPHFISQIVKSAPTQPLQERGTLSLSLSLLPGINSRN